MKKIITILTMLVITAGCKTTNKTQDWYTYDIIVEDTKVYTTDPNIKKRKYYDFLERIQRGGKLYTYDPELREIEGKLYRTIKTTTKMTMQLGGTWYEMELIQPNSCEEHPNKKREYGERAHPEL